MDINVVLPLVLAISVLSLGVAGWLARHVLAADTGKPEMKKISDAIREGAEAFLRRQYRTIALLSVVAGIVIFAFYFVNRDVKNIAEMGSGTAWRITLSFFVGALCSAVAGYIGMFVSIRANIRTATAAMTSLDKALQIALRGGAVSGLSVVSMSLLGVGGLFMAFDGLHDYQHVPLQIVGFAFGASFVALFAQLGGGIYTKAADVGADLVGKVEAGIPEDDPRNPAVIADLVGDNVGDCPGRGAGIIGIVTAYSFVWITQYYTEYKYRPVQSIAEASRTGPATNIISGLAVAFECTGLPVLVISAALLGSYWCGRMALEGMPGAG